MVLGLGKSKKSPVKEVSKSKKNEIDNALANSEYTVAYLNKKQDLLQEKVKECVAKALESNSKGDRNAALSHLKRKKLLTDELNKLRGTLLALESQNISLEGAKMQHMALSALTDSVNAQKFLQTSVNSSRFDDLMDELEEAKETQQEVLDTMNQNFATTEFDEELEELMQLEKENKLGNKSDNLDQVLKDLSAPSNEVKLEPSQKS